jgi:predicted RNase H-like HicB family nuclease
MKNHVFTAVITCEGKFFVSDCPELGVTSEGTTLEETIENLKEGVRLYLRDEPEDRLASRTLRPEP